MVAGTDAIQLAFGLFTLLYNSLRDRATLSLLVPSFLSEANRKSKPLKMKAVFVLCLLVVLGTFVANVAGEQILLLIFFVDYFFFHSSDLKQRFWTVHCIYQGVIV